MLQTLHVVVHQAGMVAAQGGYVDSLELMAVYFAAVREQQVALQMFLHSMSKNAISNPGNGLYMACTDEDVSFFELVGLRATVESA